MDIKIREQIKILLASRCMTLKQLAEILTEKTGKYYSLSNLSARLRRGTLTYNEVIEICKILEYKIDFKSLI